MVIAILRNLFGVSSEYLQGEILYSETVNSQQAEMTRKNAKIFASIILW